MQIVRTIVWVVLVIALIIFAINNWRPVEVKVWEGFVLETKIPALLILSFLIGLVPMWLLHRGKVWRLNRRISILESAARSAAASLAQAEALPPAVPETGAAGDADTDTEAAPPPPADTSKPASETP